MTNDEREKLKGAILGILLSDHMRDVARNVPALFDLAGIPIQEFDSFDEAFNRWVELEPEYFK